MRILLLSLLVLTAVPPAQDTAPRPRACRQVIAEGGYRLLGGESAFELEAPPILPQLRRKALATLEQL